MFKTIPSMKKLLFAALAVTLLGTACSSSSTSTSPGTNTFSINGANYSGTTSLTNINGGAQFISYSVNPAASINVYFTSGVPTTSGTLTTTDSILSSGKVIVSANQTNGTSQNAFIAKSGTPVNVTVNGGKVSISFTNAPAMNTITMANATISANLTQP
jgi:ABC-type Fe3+-hydroxamate transport system substrate-binding protein